jgi:hypothetical protein
MTTIRFTPLELLALANLHRTQDNDRSAGRWTRPTLPPSLWARLRGRCNGLETETEIRRVQLLRVAALDLEGFRRLNHWLDENYPLAYPHVGPDRMDPQPYLTSGALSWKEDLTDAELAELMTWLGPIYRRKHHPSAHSRTLARLYERLMPHVPPSAIRDLPPLKEPPSPDAAHRRP